MPANWHTLLLSILTAAISAVVWLIRLEAKVNYLDRMMEQSLKDRQKMADDLNSHFLRVETKLDKLNLRCAAYHADFDHAPRLDENGRE